MYFLISDFQRCFLTRQLIRFDEPCEIEKDKISLEPEKKVISKI